MAQSQLFCKIAPYYSVIIWRNRAFFVTLEEYPKQKKPLFCSY